MTLIQNRPSRFGALDARAVELARNQRQAGMQKRPDYRPRRGTGELLDQLNNNSVPLPDDGGSGGATNKSLVGLSADGATYTVQAGDTGSGIAQKLVGDGGRWKELLETNPGHSHPQWGFAANPGDLLLLPASWVKAPPAPGPTPGPYVPPVDPLPTPGPTPGPYVPPVDPLPTPGPAVLPVNPGTVDRPLTQAEVDSLRTMLGAWATTTGKPYASALAPGYPSAADMAAGVPWDGRSSAVLGAFEDLWHSTKGMPMTPPTGAATVSNFAQVAQWFQESKPVPPGGLPVGPGGEQPKKAEAASNGTMVLVLGGAAAAALLLFGGMK